MILRKNLKNGFTRTPKFGVSSQSERGFTLIEIMVSISVFSIVMLISSGSIFTVFDANRKSQTMRSVMDNLNLSLESMTRTIRFGSRYHCDITQGSGLNTTRDCAGGSGSDSIAVLDSNGVQVVYRLCPVGGPNAGRIARSVDCTAGPFITGSDVTINTLSFYVIGSDTFSATGNVVQPKVIISITGQAGVKASSRTDFRLQTMVSQRIFDSQ